MLFGKLTERAQRVLAFAQEEAIALKHSNIGTEHILLGLVKEEEGIAAKVLQSFDITEEQIRDGVFKLITEGTEMPTSLHYTPRAKRVIELSMDEARKLHHNFVGTEHILLGLIRESEGVASRVLAAAGLNITRARAAVIRMLGNPESYKRQGEKEQSETPTLDSLARDLTEVARNGQLDPVIGRSEEITRVIEILSRRTKNNPVLIGEPGVGKTAVAEGLAQAIVRNEVPSTLKDKRVMSLDMGTVVAGTKYRYEFEERMKKVMDEIKQSKNVILFIDEMHTLIGAGGAEGSVDASNILKPALSRGEVQVIGATTLEEYRKHIEKDAALERRFQPIIVDEPSVQDTILILQGLRDRYEAHHGITISDEALEAAATMSARYVQDRFLPDKAIDLIDEASSKVRLRNYTSPPDLKDLENQLESVKKEKDAAVQAQEFEAAAKHRDEQSKLEKEIEARQNDWKNEQTGAKQEVKRSDIELVISKMTGIPLSKIAEEESERLLNLEEILHEVIGQNEAVESISKAVRRARAGLKNPEKPIGSFIFLGPTGVGKTELAKALSEALFGEDDAMIRVDMSEYMEKHSVSRLVGSPPGYVGYDEGGQLTEQVRRKPYSLILFDEIEKAHPDVFNMLLQVLDDGRLTDATGRTVDFRNTVIVMTSNVGATQLRDDKFVGFGSNDDEKEDYENIRSTMMKELKNTFRPEFINRVDDIIVFHSLEKSHLEEIVTLMINELAERLHDQNIHFTVTDAAKKQLAEDGYDKEFGARPLARSIQKNIEDNLSEAILRGEDLKGKLVTVDYKDDEFIVNTTEQPVLEETEA